MKVNLAHNDGIKIFSDVAYHVEMEDEYLIVAKGAGNAFVAESSSHGALSFKHKGHKNKAKKGRVLTRDQRRKCSRRTRKGNIFGKKGISAS